MMNRYLRSFFAIFLLFVSAGNLHAQQLPSEIYRDESATGARGSMGLFANGYSRELTKRLFNLNPNAIEGRAMSALLAAAGYQLLSFDTDTGLELKPWKFNKEWEGYWTGYFAAEGLDVFLHLLGKYNGMKFVFGSSLMIATGIMIIEGESRQTWRYAQDGPLTFNNLITNRHSYWIHFASSGGLFWAIKRHTPNQEIALAYTAFFIWLWEVKDGYLWWEDVGGFGGDGFSWADGWAGTLAAAGSYALSKLLLSKTKQSLPAESTGENQAEVNNAKLRFDVVPDKEGLKVGILVRF